MIDDAIEALKKMDWGTDLGPVASIDDAIASSYGNDGARKELETKLSALLSTEISRDAKDFICRKLMTIGTAASVPALASLLTQPELSHMARFALEQIPGSEAQTALVESLGKVSGNLKVGVLGTLAKRKDESAVSAIAESLKDSDASVAKAAVVALGILAGEASAKALADAKMGDAEGQCALTNSTLACADALLASKKIAEASALYKKMAVGDQPKHVKLAAARGVLACASAGKASGK